MPALSDHEPRQASDHHREPSQLNDISTYLPDFNDAHRLDNLENARAAQDRLLRRYQNPIISYVRKALPSGEDAVGIFQEFAKNFLAGNYRSFDPGRGRFRQYLKTALFNLVHDHHRKLKRRVMSVAQVPDNPYQDPTELSDDEQFRRLWCAEVMRKGFEVLDAYERKHPRSIVGSALRLKAQDPSPRSREIAYELQKQKGFEIKEKHVRKAIHLGRYKMLNFIIDEVTATLDQPSIENIEEELIELGLHTLCKKALNERRLTWCWKRREAHLAAPNPVEVAQVFESNDRADAIEDDRGIPDGPAMIEDFEK